MGFVKFCNPLSWRGQLCSLPFSLAASSLAAGALSRRRRGLIKNNPFCSKTLLYGKYAIACNSYYIHPPVEDHNNMTKTQHQQRQDGSTQHFNSEPELNQLQQLIHSDPSGGWEKCWVQEVTPWDLGQPTPVILHLHQMGMLPKGRVLVPGCGSGHDVTAIASPDHYVIGLDISDKAIKKAVELSTSSPNADYFTFLKEDFFSWQPNELFDLIFDYTFFCAIEPNMRLAWGSRMRDLLKPDGELITLMFPISDHLGGPPYKVSVASYEEVLLPMGFKATSMMENKLAIGPRKGREKIGWWKKSNIGHSFL